MDYQTFLQNMVTSNTLEALSLVGADILDLQQTGELPSVLAYAHSVLEPTYTQLDESFYRSLHQGVMDRGLFEGGKLEAILQDPTNEFNQRILSTITQEAVFNSYGQGEEGLEAYLLNAEAGFINGVANTGIELLESGDGGNYALQVKTPEEVQKMSLLQANLMNKLILAQEVYGIALPERYSQMLEFSDKDAA